MIYEHQTIPDWLNSELGDRIKGNPRYSLRGFAQQLGLSPGELSEVLRGKRKLTMKSALKVCKALSLSPEESRHVFSLIQGDWIEKQGQGSASDPGKSQMHLREDIFQVVSEWYYFATLNFMDCEGFRWSAIEISRRLGITRTQAMQAMERLVRVGLVKSQGGRFRPSHDHILTAENVPSHAIREYHKQILSKAMESLDSQNVDERDISGTGFAIDRRQIPAMKKEISEFQEKLVKKYESRGRKNEVYQLEVALFRLTTRLGGKHE